MIDTIRIKRRSDGGAPGPPDSLAAAELAFNEVDGVLYYGKGNDDGRATEIIAIGGAATLIELEAIRVELGKLRGTLSALIAELARM